MNITIPNSCLMFLKKGIQIGVGEIDPPRSCSDPSKTYQVI